MSTYAVVDLETTGFSPAHNHRVVEIGVVLADENGRVTEEWETLVNPQRDVGATEIHGLTAGDLYAAPTFDDVAGELVSVLRGRVPVAHNLSFDALFLAAEFERLGIPVPVGPTVGLCTMRLASMYLPGGARDLSSCCECVGHRLDEAHAALADARAAAALLAHYIARDADFAASWADAIVTAEGSVWPTLPASGSPRMARQQAAAAQRGHFLGRLAARAPRSEAHPEANSYLDLIDRALLDRHISRHEEDELVSFAELLGLSRDDALSLHRSYLDALGHLALEDGVVTAEERRDLELVAGLLGLPDEAVEAALVCDTSDAAPSCELGPFTLAQGDKVVFTGQAPGIDRADLELQARRLGLRVTGSVSRFTRLVVAADPDSLSGKARKARDAGVPIVDYPTYFRMLDSGVCSDVT